MEKTKTGIVVYCFLRKSVKIYFQKKISLQSTLSKLASLFDCGNYVKVNSILIKIKAVLTGMLIKVAVHQKKQLDGMRFF
ncbi:hypothetical protein [Undibacterium crateris]|uniref:hypothetical protein n=1 Tax=Undibacterium crateris TaxID=2528175 RepID=UPI001389C5DD|nr:hypothetical protein [Undibacterium crateris]NDI86347.1 hypothetical protein [Undibacterium crateris]